jgi:hypothetical protein
VRCVPYHQRDIRVDKLSRTRLYYEQQVSMRQHRPRLARA